MLNFAVGIVFNEVHFTAYLFPVDTIERENKHYALYYYHIII